MPRRKKVVEVPAEPVVDQVPAEPVVDQVEPEVTQPVIETAPAADEDGWARPEGAEGVVITLRDFGAMRVAQDERGRKFRQYRG